MEKKLCDTCWACLPKEERHKIISVYACKNDSNSPYNEGYKDALIQLYGHHNLTSGTEPEEMLTNPRTEVQEYFYEINRTIEKTTDRDVRLQSIGKQNALKCLFGDKCLPDKPINGAIGTTPPAYKLDVRPKQPSVQGKPKFKVGDKVRKTGWDKDTTISKVEWHGTWETFVYHFKEQEYGFNCHKEDDLTLVSKRAKDPNFSIGDKVQLKFDWCRLLKVTLLTIKDIPAIDRDDTFMYSFEETDEYIRETMLEPYTEPETKMKTIEESLPEASNIIDENFENLIDNSETKDMEEKELNLAELLKGCEGEKFYSRAYGEVTLNEIVRDVRPNSQEIKCYTSDPQSDRIWFLRNGLKHKNGGIDLYPSRALYEKYPLDAYSAWMEWREARKPKYILQAEIRLISNDGKTIEDYENVEVEVSDVDLTQAAEAVRDTLNKIHESFS